MGGLGLARRLACVRMAGHRRVPTFKETQLRPLGLPSKPLCPNLATVRPRLSAAYGGAMEVTKVRDE